MTTGYPKIPETDAEAEAKYQEWKQVDPFPTIPPALLNSADIEDYVRATGMLFPFQKEKDGEPRLKSASYGIDALGRVVRWDETGQKIQESLLAKKDSFKLKSNSIAFIELEPTIRLPDYIGVRFNLEIVHVHRGILLGTGPLVDPGFQGRLLIPLHNWTDNDYEIFGGDGLIWMEFTKLSWPPPGRREVGQGDAFLRSGDFVSFPARKLRRREPDDYLRRASPDRPIRSSIPANIVATKAAAESAHDEVRRLTNYGYVALAAVFLSILGLIVQAMLFVHNIRNNVEGRLGSIEAQLHGLVEKSPAGRDASPTSRPEPSMAPGQESGSGARGGQTNEAPTSAIAGTPPTIVGARSTATQSSHPAAMGGTPSARRASP